MTDLDKTEIFKVIAPVGNQIPAIHEAGMFFDLPFEAFFREGILYVPEISFKPR